MWATNDRKEKELSPFIGFHMKSGQTWNHIYTNNKNRLGLCLYDPTPPLPHVDARSLVWGVCVYL